MSIRTLYKSFKESGLSKMTFNKFKDPLIDISFLRFFWETYSVYRLES